MVNLVKNIDVYVIILALKSKLKPCNNGNNFQESQKNCVWVVYFGNPHYEEKGRQRNILKK